MWLDGGLLGEFIQSALEGNCDIGRFFLECMQYRHKNLAGSGPGIGLRAEADLPGYHKRAKFTLGPIVVRRNIAIIRPVI